MSNLFWAVFISGITIANQGCTKSTVNTKDSMNDEVAASDIKYNNTPTDSVSSFTKFSNSFDNRDLPFELNFGSNDWKNFNSEEPLQEIPRKEAIAFLCGNQGDCLKETKSGAYQYYWGYKIKINQTIGLIYYRTSSDYAGYILSTFDSTGKLQGTLVLAGIKGEYDPEVQRESFIDEEGNIEIREINISEGFNYDQIPFDVEVVTENYRVAKDGEIILISKSPKVKAKAITSKEQKDRVIIVE